MLLAEAKYDGIPVAQSLVTGNLIIPFAPTPGTETSPEVLQEQAKVKAGTSPGNTLTPRMMEALRNQLKYKDKNGYPPLHAQAIPRSKIEYLPLSSADRRRCIDLRKTRGKGMSVAERGKWIDQRLGNSLKSIKGDAEDSTDITPQDVAAFFARLPNIYPLGNYHMTVDVFDSNTSQLVSITSSNSLLGIGCEGSKAWFKLKILHSAMFEKAASTKSWADNGVLESNKSGHSLYVVKITLANGDVQFWDKKEPNTLKFSGSYRVSYQGFDYYNKKVVCVVPWRVGGDLLNGCYIKMQQELQDFADKQSDAVAPGFLKCS
jgi:hypothetical protein